MEWEGWYGKVVDEDSPLEDNIYVVQYAAGVAIHGKRETSKKFEAEKESSLHNIFLHFDSNNCLY